MSKETKIIAYVAQRLYVVRHSSEFSFSITGGKKLWIYVKDKSVKIPTEAKTDSAVGKY